MIANDLKLLLALNGNKRLPQLEQDIFSSDNETIIVYLRTLIIGYLYDVNEDQVLVKLCIDTLNVESIPWAVSYYAAMTNDACAWPEAEPLLNSRFSDSQHTVDYYNMKQCRC